MSLQRVSLFAVMVSVLAACSAAPEKPRVRAVPTSAPADRPGTLTLDRARLPALVRFNAGELDQNSPACVDFDRYANGTWRTATAIPDDQYAWGTWEMLIEHSLAVRRQIAEHAALAQTPDTNTKIVGDFWSTGMDADSLNATGIAPLEPELRQIDALDSPAAIADYLRKASARGATPLFGFKAGEDFRDARVNIAYVERGGISMPNPSWYVLPDMQPLRDAYLAYITQMLTLTGTAEAEQRARDVLAFETRLARVARTREERAADVSLEYNPVSPAQADQLTPNFSWRAFFEAQGLAVPRMFSLAEPAFHQEISRMLVDTPPRQWQAYLRFRSAHAAAPYLSDAIAEPGQRLLQFALGTKAPPPRWKRVLDTIDLQASDPIGQLYVAVAFPPDSKSRVNAIVEHIRAALKTRIEALTWMSDATKQNALAKWTTFRPNIGYPDRWRDFSALTTDRSSYFANVMAARAFNYRWNIARIGQPIDRTEWIMPAQAVNAMYTPSRNEITFAAAFLQPPFFDATADDALNYGGIGAVIGHEMIHGYDDQGSRFGPTGNFEDWWTAADRQAFTARTDKLVAQFNQYEAAPGAFVNGAYTLSENIADLGGLAVAYDAMHLATAGQADPMIDRFTRDQRFFLAWAVSWRNQQTSKGEVISLSMDTHAPSSIRSFAASANLPAFANAFGCKPGDAVLRGASQVDIW